MNWREPIVLRATRPDVSHDSEIITASRDRPAAFAELYDRHATSVYRYAARRIDRGAAEDIMSETFLVAFERRETFDSSYENALPWLLGIATTLIRKRARLEARAWKGMLAEHEAASVSIDQIERLGLRLDAESSIGKAITAIRRMSDGDRDVLLLHAWGDLTYEQIAIALEIPIGTVRSRLNRARTTLRAVLDRAGARVEEVDHGRVDSGSCPAQR